MTNYSKEQNTLGRRIIHSCEVIEDKIFQKETKSIDLYVVNQDEHKVPDNPGELNSALKKNSHISHAQDIQKEVAIAFVSYAATLLEK